MAITQSPLDFIRDWRKEFGPIQSHISEIDTKHCDVDTLHHRMTSAAFMLKRHANKILTLEKKKDMRTPEVTFTTKYKMGIIMEIVAGFFGIDEDEIRGQSRKRYVCVARQTYCYVAHSEVRTSLKSIGATLENRDHSTVIYSCRAMQDLIDAYDEHKDNVDRILVLVQEAFDRDEMKPMLVTIEDAQNIAA